MFARYLAVSTVSLGVDYAVLLHLVWRLQIRESVAAAAAYLCGAVVHYAASRHWVFAPGWLHRQPLIEFATFIASGLVGLALTTCIVFVASELGRIPLTLSKAIAVVASYFATYSIRKVWVFRGRQGERSDRVMERDPGGP